VVVVITLFVDLNVIRSVVLTVFINLVTSLPVGRTSRRAEPRTLFKHHRLDLIL
jgi:hypothetical protein